jgi:hypothetical protein
LRTCLAFSRVNSSDVTTSSMTPPMLILDIFRSFFFISD